MVFLALIALVAETDDRTWIRVKKHGANSVTGSKMDAWTSFSEVINKGSAPVGPEIEIPLANLKPPLPEVKPKSLGLGLSYPSHQDEVKAATTVFFEKNAEPTPLTQPVIARAHLDFEAEVALLLHRQEPQLFGYLMHNDLTDRGVQVANYDKNNQAPGFSKSKSFAGANAHGPLLAIGSNELWSQLNVELYRNGKLVQSVNPRENVLNPADIHQHVFGESDLASGKDWVLIGTGTPAGTIFRAPTLAEKICLIFRAGFNMQRAQTLWLENFEFLKSGDLLEFRSKLLGTALTTIK